MKSGKNFYNYLSFLKDKRGVSTPEKILFGVIIIIFLFGMAPLIMGDSFLGNAEVVEGFPTWFIPFLILGLIIGVYWLIVK